MSKHWDFIVIGAGHNGLTAACVLATSGKSVLVVDQRPIIGGLSASYAYQDNAPNHLLSLGAMDDAYMASSAVNTQFDLKNNGYTPIRLEAPYGWMNEEGDNLLLFADFNHAVEEIRYFSPKDAQAYQDIRSTINFLLDVMDKMGAKHPKDFGKLDTVSTLLKLAKDKQVRKTLGRMISISAFEMVAETFESEAMRGLWAFWTSMMGPPTFPGSGVNIVGFGGVHRSGIFRPKGGMTGLVGALCNVFKKHNGELKLNSTVAEIMVNDKNTATGVQLTNGEQLFARCGVIASCAPQLALGKLLGDGVLEPKIKQRVAFIPANSAGVAPLKIDMATSGELSYPKAQQKRQSRDNTDLRKTTFMTGTLEDHIAQHDACIRGESVDFLPPMYFSILSGADPSIAPEGGDVLYVYANAPVTPSKGWQVEKSAYCQQVMASCRRFIGGLETEIARVETCPQDFIEQFSAPNATYNHVDILPTRMGLNRPAPELGGYQTPVNGLYLASAGSHPGGGVSGMPGKLGAECALKHST